MNAHKSQHSFARFWLKQSNKIRPLQTRGLSDIKTSSSDCDFPENKTRRANKLKRLQILLRWVIIKLKNKSIVKLYCHRKIDQKKRKGKEPHTWACFNRVPAVTVWHRANKRAVKAQQSRADSQTSWWVRTAAIRAGNTDPSVFVFPFWRPSPAGWLMIKPESVRGPLLTRPFSLSVLKIETCLKILVWFE